MATVEIDGITLEAENGQMIIEVADDAGIHIPRFCYHKKLSVAANCRMCLVSIENGRKPVPACATPITNGMKVFTQSEEALRSQKAVMEFLLINHPLDCPICDQGGECELQDVSMGFGGDDSHFHETKRAVDDDNLGALIATEMTRCIHCTRCVRFGTEIAGLRELGATGRGENMQIGTFIEHSLTSEVSGNVIDLCPVGALTSKPYRYTARAWELQSHPSISMHDCLGTNIYFHVRRNEVMRVVPRENETINETWISDRDRFSYAGINSESRATMPRIKRDGHWQTVDWETALTFAADGLAKVIKLYGPEQVAGFTSYSATLEELYTFQKLLRGLGINNIDHRLHQADFSDEARLSSIPSNTAKIADIEKSEAVMLVGCNITREVPLAGLRVRKAFKNGAKIFSVNPASFDTYTDITDSIIVSTPELPIQLATLLKALDDKKSPFSIEVEKLLLGLEPNKSHQRIAKALKSANAMIITGAIAENHPHASLIRVLLALIQEKTGAKNIHLTTGANAAGAWLAGVLPHRQAAGKTSPVLGLNVQDALSAKLKAYVLMGVEPGFDFNDPHKTRQALLGAEFVVALSAFDNKSMEDYANVILPMATFAETSGTYINVDGIWQTVAGAVSPKGEARPGWKILRVLGNLLKIDGFDYISSDDILTDVKNQYAGMHAQSYMPVYPEALPLLEHALTRLGEWPLYGADALVRRATALQQAASADKPCIKMHPITAEKYKLKESATIAQGDIEITLPLVKDERMAQDVIGVANAMSETADLGQAFGSITIKR